MGSSFLSTALQPLKSVPETKLTCLSTCRDAPREDRGQSAQEVCDFIDRYVSATIPPQHGPDDVQHLRDLVLRVQQHRHADTCRKSGQGTLPEGRCRFKYPRPTAERTRMRTSSDHGLRRSDTYIMRRGPQDVHTAPYNAECLGRQVNLPPSVLLTTHPLS